MSASRDGTFHPAVEAVICVGGVCVIVRQEDYSIRYRKVWFMSLCLLSLASSFFSLNMNMCNFFPGHLSGCCEYVRTEMMLNMTQKRAKSFKMWETCKI